MAIITSMRSRWILDSRGLPTVQTEITLDQNGKKGSGKSSVPSGASTGTYEALELRDGEKDFLGKGVNHAVDNVLSKIGKNLANRDFNTAVELDEYILSLDPSDNKNQIGANAILSVSMASHRAFAQIYGLELWQYLRHIYFNDLGEKTKFPRLMCNVINGGRHADNGIDIQEFMIVPKGNNSETDIRLASEVYHTLKNKLKKDGFSTALGDEGGFAPNLSSTGQALNYLQKAISEAGYSNLEFDLALDVAANEFYLQDKNLYKIENEEVSQSQLVDFYKQICEAFSMISIEDPFAEDDIIGWELVSKVLGKKINLIGDDLFVTNPKRFQELGIKSKLANGVLIKLNQIGSVLETCQMINLAKANEYITIISHRSGETTDDFIADLAFASQSEFIKLGAPARGERVVKYNRLLEIWESVK